MSRFPEAINEQWERIKAEEKQRTGLVGSERIDRLHPVTGPPTTRSPCA